MEYKIVVPSFIILVTIIVVLFKLIRFFLCVKGIQKKQASDINNYYKGYYLSEDLINKVNLPNLDPAGFIQLFVSKKIIRIVFWGNIPIILQRIEECIDRYKEMVEKIRIDQSLSKDKIFMLTFFNNTLLYHFMIELLVLNRGDRNDLFNKFSKNKNFLYDLYDGYFKAYSTISYNHVYESLGEYDGK